MTNKLQSIILELIRKKSKIYPVTTEELVVELSYSNGTIHRYVKLLEKCGCIEVKRVTLPKGGVTYYKTPETVWPKHLGMKCFDCQNKGKNAECNYYEELAEKGVIKRPDRVGVKLTKNTVACDDFIEKKIRWKKRRYEDFLDENRRITVSETGLRISYHCANEKCQAELPFVGNGFIAKLGSSTIRCDVCNSFYKTLFDQKKKAFFVNYNLEKGIEYKENFAKATGGEEPEPLYSCDKFGIVIHDMQSSNFNFRTRTLTTYNWLGKLEDINYLVVKKVEDYDYMIELLDQKRYDIDIILGADKLISPPPIKQQVGLLRLLRVIMIINKEFCIAILKSRITVIEKVHEQFNREEEIVVRRAIKIIKERIKEVEGKKWITPKEWNALEMRAGNAMWGVVKVYLKKLGIDYPGRGGARLVEDISMPYRRFYAYSQIDLLINGVYGIAGEFVKKNCQDIGFCWDGLPGLCHGKTRGGVFGFHLDMREQDKVITIPYLLEALKSGTIEMEKVLYYRGRNRQKVYYLKHETELEEQIYEVVEEMRGSEINGKRAKNVIREHYLQGKQWLGDYQRISNNFVVEHNEVEYQPWAIMKMKIWEILGREEKEELINYLKREHKKMRFKPLTVMEMN